MVLWSRVTIVNGFKILNIIIVWFVLIIRSKKQTNLTCLTQGSA